jgi:hypothetical protein
MALVLNLQNHGLGTHFSYVSPQDLSIFAKTVYAGQLMWHIGSSLVRFSVLAFYARIFRVRTNSHSVWTFAYWLTLTTSVVWLLVIFLLDGVGLCQPISRFWDKSLEGSCLPQFTLFIVGTAGAVITNSMVVLLPLPQVLNLNMKRRKKMGISIAFILGYRSVQLTLLNSASYESFY